MRKVQRYSFVFESKVLKMLKVEPDFINVRSNHIIPWQIKFHIVNLIMSFWNK